ncbi:MAG: hypothetical protein ABUL73_01280 [Alphaproteobacteria bacterium]
MKKLILAPVLLAMTLLVTGCLSLTPYVDPTLGDVPAAQRVTVASPQPVQLIFEFHTKGALNRRATNLLEQQATEIVRSSGLFSEVSTAPVSNGALLSITIDNVPEADAAGKGFATGLTFGLAASTVTDYYVGTARYAPGAGAAVINAEERHSIHSVVGAGSGPPGMVRSPNLEAAFRQVLQQLMSHLLNDVARSPGFSGAAPAPSAAPSATGGPGIM